MPKKNLFKNITDVVTQVVMESFISKRDITYELKTSIEKDSVYSKIEATLNDGVVLYLHQATRSKKLNDEFSGLNMGINYEKVINVKKDVANVILETRDENNGVFIPSCLFPGHNPFFGIDNTDKSRYNSWKKSTSWYNNDSISTTHMWQIPIQCIYK